MEGADMVYNMYQIYSTSQIFDSSGFGLSAFGLLSRDIFPFILIKFCYELPYTSILGEVIFEYQYYFFTKRRYFCLSTFLQNE